MRIIKKFLIGIAVTGACLACATAISVKPIKTLQINGENEKSFRVTDRHNIPLSVSYQGKWNIADYTPLYNVPETLKTFFIQSEDKNFYSHYGVDWQARAAALYQNIKARRTVRGASTITEQVVRMLHPRSRSLWSKWIEGFEATLLEQHATKTEIFEFYLNQVPYGANRRGITQAAQYYFDRDLSTLTPKEMAALAILARAPSNYDLYKNPKIIEKTIDRFLASIGTPQSERQEITKQNFSLSKSTLPVDASHFIRYVRTHLQTDKTLDTTLDASIQGKVQSILDKRLETLKAHQANNGAVLIADHQTGEIIAWVIGGALSGTGQNPTPGWTIDAVTTPRQPGSSMKPFLYAAAIDKGWTAATMIDDSPLSEAIGTGLHNFRNYSRQFYGPLPLRETLGNSLNIPALKTIRYVGVGPYLTLLHDLGFSTLDQSSSIYDEGLALGNAEVTLYDLVQGYASLANHGIYTPLHSLQTERTASQKRIFSDEAASLIGNILSDPYARRFEFGTNSVLNFPVQTAVKTGTSNDYHDAWAVGYNDRYVVGVWIGNLDRSPMNGVTGSTGAALVLRSTFAELNKFRETKPLYLSPHLQQHEVCIPTKKKECFMRTEYFIPGTEPHDNNKVEKAQTKPRELVRPTDHLQIAYDPRIPADKQRFRFELSSLDENEKAEWILNGTSIATTSDRLYLWPLTRGKYTLSVIIHKDDQKTELPNVNFIVK